MKILKWRDVAPACEAFHALRDAKTARNPVRIHGHDFAEVFWIDAGHGAHRVNGARGALRPGSLVFIRPTDVHAIEPSANETLHLTNIAFPRETYDHLKNRYLAKLGPVVPGGQPPRWQVGPARLDLLNRQADELAQAPRERLHIERFLLNLFVELQSPTDDPGPQDMPGWLFHACREIRKPEHFPHGAERFVRLACRSREHVARTARQFLGVTPTDCVNSARMDYAAGRLAMSNQEIMEIALDCGIGNLSHFYELFRARFHMPPGAYRKSRRKPV